VQKRQLIITAVVLEGRSPTEVAATYGVARSWVNTLVKRYLAEGETAYQPRSRRPKNSPRRTADTTVTAIVAERARLTRAGLDAGPHTIAWHLATHQQLTVSPATIWRVLHRAGLVTPAPKKRPKTSYIRFQADLPNETWQTDFTHVPLADGTDSEVLTFLDDHSRKALSITAHRTVTGPAVLTAFINTTNIFGFPASVLSDNGTVFTGRFVGGRSGLENHLHDHHIIKKNSSPGHPQTCGKVERFQQTMKNWLTAQPPPATLPELQAQLDTFITDYNDHRPHRSLNRRTPTAAYLALPKATPQKHGGTIERVRHDHVDADGKLSLRRNAKMHHIGVGRDHAGTPVLMLIQDLNIRIVHATTGQLIRALTLDPTRDYQPTGRSRYEKWRTP
jgi:transposase InsO family protein